MGTQDMQYDVSVVGAGHAGVEAAVAAARMGARVALITLRQDRIGEMSCNPAIGGLAKGQLVREVDALGGVMGRIADASTIQFRMLNTRKGPAVRAPRSQNDRVVYREAATAIVAATDNLDVVEAEVADLLVDREGERPVVRGCVLADGRELRSGATLLTTGTFLRGLMHRGEVREVGGRADEPAARSLTSALEGLGLAIGRLKTGTPPRLDADSIDFSALEVQAGDEDPRGFSFFGPKPSLPQIDCHLTYTNEKTHEVIRDNLHRSPMYTGQIEGVGPRYCPSIEDKVMRFADRDRHLIFLEPEGLDTNSIYVNGISTSLPQEAQQAFLGTIPGLEQARVLRYGYAVEYDFVYPNQIDWSLRVRSSDGLYLAGQINGTSGYEEAAAQGLMAGINAVRLLDGQSEPFALDRSEAYIGVLIDDLVRSTPREPYRMFTSRAEFRLKLRDDNADRRLSHRGHALGLIADEQLAQVEAKAERIDRARQKLEETHVDGKSLAAILCRPEMTWEQLREDHVAVRELKLGEEDAMGLTVDLKYRGYLERQERDVARMRKLEERRIPDNFDYASVTGLRKEALEKLESLTPPTLGAASRIAGVSPADLSILVVFLDRHQRAATVATKG